MLATNEHEWVNSAATKLVLGGDILWQAMCGEWVRECLPAEDADKITLSIEDALLGAPWKPAPAATAIPAEPPPAPTPTASSEQQKLF